MPRAPQRRRWPLLRRLLLAAGSVCLLLLLLLLVPPVAAQGFYGAPSFTAQRTRNMTSRAHAVVLVDQCRPASSPRYFLWGGVKNAAMDTVDDAWYTDDGYTFKTWYAQEQEETCLPAAGRTSLLIVSSRLCATVYLCVCVCVRLCVSVQAARL